MKNPPPLGLICAGRADHNWIARFPGVAENLGPVKAGSFRLASRVSNSLRCGYPVRSMSELSDCRILLLCLPDRGVKRAVEELEALPHRWKSAGVVLVSAMLDSSELQPLVEKGASAASVHLLNLPDGKRFLMEGDRELLRELREMLPADAKFLQLSPEGKRLCLAGLFLASTALAPIVHSASQYFTGAGLHSREAATLMEQSIQSSLRGYLKSGRAARGDMEDHLYAERQLEVIGHTNPDLRQWLEHGRRKMAVRLRPAPKAVRTMAG
jgi:hypothetical protein